MNRTGLFQRARWQVALVLSVSLTATLLVAAPLASAAEVTTTNWWPGNGNVDDVVGTQHGSTANGAGFSPGKVGQAFSLDGVDDYVTLGNVAGNAGTADFTVALWLKTSSSGRHEGIIAKRPSCSHGSMFDVRLDPTGKVYVELDGSSWGTDYNFLISSVSVNDGSFHHVAVVRKGTAASLYVDGRLQVTKSTSGITTINNGATLTAGKSPCTGIDGTRYFTGTLDEIVVGPDRDGDGRPNAVDNCPNLSNTLQEDQDGDGIGDACQAPAAPSLGNLFPADGASSSSPTPALSATFDDPNTDDDGYVEFEVYREGNLVASNAGGSPAFVQPGQTVTWQVPTGSLEGGRTYTWRARAFDGVSYSPWTSNPAGRALTIGGTYPAIDQWTGDQATGRVDYGFKVTAAALNAPGELAGPCYQLDCSWKVEARYSDGAVQRGLGIIASGTLPHDASSMNETVSGVMWMEVTDIRTIVDPGSCYGCLQGRVRYDSGWVRVGEPYATGDVNLAVNSWERDSATGSHVYDLTMSASGAAQIGGPCQEKPCRWRVEARYEDGFVGGLGSGQLPMGTWTLAKAVTGTATGGRITDVKATLESMCAVTSEYWCWDPYETYTTGWIFVGDLMVDGKDLVPYSIAMAEGFAANRLGFCEPLLLKPYPNTNGNSLNDVFESCEALVLEGATLAVLLQALARQAPDSVDELLEFWERNPAPTEEDRSRPLLPYTGAGDAPECELPIWGKDDPQVVGHIEKRHTWRAGRGASEFYPWADWRWLVDYAESLVPPSPSGANCQRIVRYEPTHVGIVRILPQLNSPIAGEPTRWYTVVTQPNGKLVTVYPGTLGD